jgi:hypothetical protein
MVLFVDIECNCDAEPNTKRLLEAIDNRFLVL